MEREETEEKQLAVRLREQLEDLRGILVEAKALGVTVAIGPLGEAPGLLLPSMLREASLTVQITRTVEY